MATCVDAAGASYPQEQEFQPIHPLEGESLLPAFWRPGWSRQAPIYWEHGGNCAIRQGDWKMVKKYPGTWELYNMEQDRTEQKNLIDKDQDRAAAMEKLYNTWAERCGANWIINKVEIVYRWLKPGTLVHFRNRIGEEGVKKILKLSIDLHGMDAQEARVVIDTREQEKNITCQTYG